MQGNDSTKYNIYVNMYIYVYYIYIYIYINKGYRLIFSLVLVDGMFVLVYWFSFGTEVPSVQLLSEKL